MGGGGEGGVASRLEAISPRHVEGADFFFISSEEPGSSFVSEARE